MPTFIKFPSFAYVLVISLYLAGLSDGPLLADYYATANTGEIYRFTRDGNTLTPSVFVNLGPGQLSGLAYNEIEDVMYASMLSSGEIFRIDLAGGIQSIQVGSVALGAGGLEVTTGFAPAGLGFDSHGVLHVATFADSSPGGGYGVYRLSNGDFASPVFAPVVSTAPILPFVPTLYGGVGFLPGDEMVVSSAVKGIGGEGILLGAANAQIAVSPDGQSYFVGSSQLQAGDNNPDFSSVFEFDATGGPLQQISISDSLLGLPDGIVHLGSPSNPAGVAFDAEGNLIVSVLGSSDLFNPKGALLLFDTSDFQTPLATWHGNLAFSNVIWVPTAVPEPSSMILILLGGVGSVLRLRWKRKKMDLRPGMVLS